MSDGLRPSEIGSSGSGSDFGFVKSEGDPYASPFYAARVGGLA